MASFSGAPNPNLGWEKTNDYKISLDFGLFGDRLSGIVEGYRRISTDVVISSKIPSTTGYTYQDFNSADIVNNGIEFTLNGQIVRMKDLQVNASVNFAYNMNMVTRYDSPDKLTASTRYWEGYPTDALFIGKVTGLNSQGLYQFQLRPDAVIESREDYQVADNYRYFLGTGIAPYTGGFNLSITWKGLSLSCFGAFSWGSKTFEEQSVPGAWSSINRQGVDTEIPQTIFSDLYTNHLNVRRDRTDRWTPSRTEGVKYPRIVDPLGEVLNLDLYNVTSSSITLGSFLEDVSYLRVRDITLSYNLPRHLLEHWGISSLGFSVMASNLFTFTNYSGIDPETPGQTYPITRSVAFGINLGF